MPQKSAKGCLVHQIVPKASGVAAAVHHPVPSAAISADVCPAAIRCPHSSAACPALAGLFSDLTPAGDDASAWIRALAPCSRCRIASESGRDGLRHLRLGQREREILIGAEEGAFVVTEAGMTRSLSAARRRAALSLGKAGLVAPVSPSSDASARAAKQPARATVALTPLGTYVMAAYGRFIRAGKPVRWTRPARGAMLPGEDPALLRGAVLDATETALRDTLTDLKRTLIAAIAKPVKDPQMLDRVTQHLEQKATLLKAVLAPARSPARAATA